MQCKEAIAQYLFHLRNLNKSPHTLKQYRIDLEQLAQALGEARIEDVTSEDFRHFAIHYEDVLLEAGFKPTSVRRKISSLRSFVHYLAVAHIIEEDFKSAILHTQPYQVEVRIPSMTEVSAVYHHYEEPVAMTSYEEWLPFRNRSIVQLMIDTGLKVAEIKNLRWGHFNREERKLALLRKNLTFQWIDLMEKTVEDLQHYAKRTAELFDFEWEEGHALYFTDRGLMNEPMSERTVERVVERATAGESLDVRGSELRYFRLLQRSIQEDPEDLLKHFGYASKEQMIQRLQQLKPKR